MLPKTRNLAARIWGSLLKFLLVYKKQTILSRVIWPCWVRIQSPFSRIKPCFPGNCCSKLLYSLVIWNFKILSDGRIGKSKVQWFHKLVPKPCSKSWNSDIGPVQHIGLLIYRIFEKLKSRKSPICCTGPISAFQLFELGLGTSLWNHFDFPNRSFVRKIKSNFFIFSWKNY